MTVAPWVWLVAGWLVLEALSLGALRYLHWRTAVYYLPRLRPRLSRRTLETLERLVAANGRGAVMEHSAVLGWTVQPHVRSPNGRVHSNSHGLRGERETTPVPAPGVTRVLTFGDCVTWGEGVADDGTIQRCMEKSNGSLEVLNFGVDGWSPVQMLLRYRECATWCREHSVAIMLMASSNVFKPLNSFRPFMAYDHGLPFGLPHARLHEGRLEILPNPLASLDDYQRLLANPVAELRRVGATDHYYRTQFAWSPFDVLPSVRVTRTVLGELKKLHGVVNFNGVYRGSSLAAGTTICVLEAFAAEARARNARPIIAVIPAQRDIRAFAARGTRPSRQVVDAVRARGIECIDLLEALGPVAKEKGIGPLFNRWHYSERANEIVAGCLLEALRSDDAAAPAVNQAGGRTLAGMRRAARDP